MEKWLLGGRGSLKEWLWKDSFGEKEGGAVPVLPRYECGAGSAPRIDRKRWRRAGVRAALNGASTYRSARTWSGESRRGASEGKGPRSPGGVAVENGRA